MPVIHALQRGFAACGLPGMPADWPEDHKWVSVIDPNRDLLVTCQGCRMVLGLLLAGSMRDGPVLKEHAPAVPSSKAAGSDRNKAS